MSKTIIIVGGGISGLTVLHHLRKKHANTHDVAIKLLEMEDSVGGTVRTIRRNGTQFEAGPNAFLDSKPSTLELAQDLGLESDLTVASTENKIRYICLENNLYQLPKSPISFFRFKPLTFIEKLRAIMEVCVPRGQNPNETVYEFGTRRLGEGIAKYFLDPLVSGICAGDSHELNLQFTFPTIYSLEQKHNSLIRGMFANKKGKSGQLRSFKHGMGQLIEKLAQQHADSIVTGIMVDRVLPQKNGYDIQAGQTSFFADELILSTPAFATANIVNAMNPDLAKHLREIPYASITVVGLVYTVEQFKTLIRGFGYLRPTHEGKEILGVLFSSQIFPSRVSQGKVLLQVLLGGAKHPQTIRKSEEEIFDIAQEEIKNVLGVTGHPQDQFIFRWGKAIPQYNRAYPKTYSTIKNTLQQHPHLHLLANYLDGIALNDCTANAKALADKINL
ncbi:MAG: protoporphyrinogen oxidase [Candidatus Omnitrophica bacterium]|nr:protoporphyrinogen oxidase [Candidatus Omnitrophota bacterium]